MNVMDAKVICVLRERDERYAHTKKWLKNKKGLGGGSFTQIYT